MSKLTLKSVEFKGDKPGFNRQTVKLVFKEIIPDRTEKIIPDYRDGQMLLLSDIKGNEANGQLVTLEEKEWINPTYLKEGSLWFSNSESFLEYLKEIGER